VRGQQHESEETRREETNGVEAQVGIEAQVGVEAQVGIAEVEEDGTFRPQQVCRGTEDDARKEVVPRGEKDGDQKNRAATGAGEKEGPAHALRACSRGR
jgi:hypothetical protein